MVEAECQDGDDVSCIVLVVICYFSSCFPFFPTIVLQEAKEAVEAREEIEEETGDLREAMEMATLDKEMAEEKVWTGMHSESWAIMVLVIAVICRSGLQILIGMHPGLLWPASSLMNGLRKKRPVHI